MSSLRSSPVRFHSLPAAKPCDGCQVAIIRVGSPGDVCPACERAQVVADISRTLSDVQAIRDGTGVFEGMTIAERNEQLAALGLPAIDSPARFPGFATMPDDALIGIIAGDACFMPGEKADAVAEATIELTKRLAGWAPSPRERELIEASAVVIAGEPEAITRRVIVDQEDAERWDCCA